MARPAGLRLLLAFDGSAGARGAIAAALRAPWPRGTRANAVVAADPGSALDAPAIVFATLERGARAAAEGAQRALRRRWPAARAQTVPMPPVAGILAQARGDRAQVIVLGSNRAGFIGRLLLGSVSSAVARRATCSVLVVKGRPRFRHVLLAMDGSANARRAVALVARLVPPPGGRVTVVQAVEPLRLPSLGMMPGNLRATLHAQARAVEQRAEARARRTVEAAAARLSRRGWRVDTAIRRGAPVPELLAAARTIRADVIALGARGVTRLQRLLLGSVAEGVLAKAQISALVVR